MPAVRMRSRTRRKRALGIVALGAPLLLGACATEVTQHRDWSDYQGPGAEHFQKEELVMWTLPDPMEPTNRTIDDGKHFVAEYVFAPLAWVWRGITPRAFRTGLTNVGQNLLFPVRVVSNSLQGNWNGAGHESKRFGINTTLGLLGWSDAAAAHDLPARRAENMGATFQHHGWQNSAYMALPEPTVRDSVGFIPDLFLDPLFYFSPATLARRFNDHSDKVDKYVSFTNTVYDPYLLERLARHLDRELEDTDDEFAAGMGGAVDTLQYVFLGLKDPAFASASDQDEVAIAATGKELPFSYWLQDHPAPIVYLVPGTGGHRNAESSMAYAEMVFDAGYHAVLVSSTLNWEFVKYAATVNFAGFAPDDARDTHNALTAIDAHMRAEHGGLIGRQRGLLGVSLGAFHSLYIAADEHRSADQGRITFDAYVAINPPVDLLRAVEGFDHYYNLPLEYFTDQKTQHQQIKALFRHVIDVAGGGDLRPGNALPLNEKQAQFLIGVAFRLSLMSLMDNARARGVTGDFFLTPRTPKDRTASYRELSRYSFMEYLYAFVLPEQARRRDDITNTDAGAAELAHLCDLRSLAPQLKSNPRIRVLTNRNDMLLNPGDTEFLQHTFGNRLTLDDAGGHLGSLWRPDIQKRLIDKLRHLVPVPHRRAD